MDKVRRAIECAAEKIGLDIGGTTVLQLEANRLTPHVYGVEVLYFDEFEGTRVTARARVRFSYDFSKCEVARTQSATVT